MRTPRGSATPWPGNRRRRAHRQLDVAAMAEAFHIGIGGPFHRLERAAGVDKLGRLVPLLVGATWAPLALLTLAEWMLERRPEPLLRDLSVHARLLIALPLLLFSQRFLDRSCGTAIARLFDEGYVPAASTARVRALLRRVERWRDAALPEALLLLVALGAGIATLVGWLAPTGLAHGLSESRLGAVRIWYALLSLPLFQFVLWRSLLRWALWVCVLVGLARVPLRLLPAHADRCAGLSLLKQPTLAYWPVLLLAASSVLCAGWVTQVTLYGASIDRFRPVFVGCVLIGVVVALAPLLVFLPQLVRARLLGLRQYGGLVSDYTQRFNEHWIDRTERPDLLGTPEIQSFADLSTAYRENVEKIGFVIFGVADGLLLLVAALVPALPFLFLQGSAHDAIKKLLGLVAGFRG
jgi:hypothetical protein